MVRILFISLLIWSLSIKADTNYHCMENCSSSGYAYAYCQMRCGYNNAGIETPTFTPNLNSKCYSHCTEKGNSGSYCQENCTSYSY